MIQTIIDNHLAEKRAKPRKRSGKFSPSMFGRCYQAQIWNRADEPKTNPPDARQLRVFEAGRLFHDFVQQFIEAENTEVLIAVDDDIVGYADIVTSDTVWDLKSVHSKQFWWTSKKDYDVFEGKYPNWLQVMYYAWRLNKERGALAFISKDDLCIGEYADYTEKWIDDLECEIYHLRKYWDCHNQSFTDHDGVGSEIVVPAEPRAYNGKECQYCDWCDKCTSPKKYIPKGK